MSDNSRTIQTLEIAEPICVRITRLYITHACSLILIFVKCLKILIVNYI